VLLDLSPLGRSRDFRALIGGLGVSTLGNQLTTVSVPYQVYAITHSSLYVGLVSLTQLFPLIAGRCSVGRSPTRWTGGGCCSWSRRSARRPARGWR
jgi:hypothetical protein